MNTAAIYGKRKGKATSLKQILKAIAAKTLQVFPVPGLDVLLSKGFDPNQKGVSIAATPRHANVLLVTSPMPQPLAKYVANVYAQMPRPRMLVLVDTPHAEPMPPPDAELSLNEINQLHQKLNSHSEWSEDAAPYNPPSMDEGEKSYTCPMHPEVQSDQPGTCPKCGMALVKKDEAQSQHKHHEHHEQMQSESEKSYTCPMHPEVQSDKPGTCPICGMALVKKDEAQSQHKHHEHHEQMQSEGEKSYTCPMHPEVKSDKPGTCPKCGMALVKKDEAQSQHKHHEHHEQMQNESEKSYTCSMHPEVESDKPGTCPKCGMALVKKDEAQSQHKHHEHHEQMQSENEKSYTCPMHPEVKSDKSGTCPKCGMALVKKDEDQSQNKHHEHEQMQSEGEKSYTCPMHPEVKSDKPGTCPKCGMALVKKDEAQSQNKHEEHEQMQSEGEKSYTCPMHPEVQSDQPGTCPKCGMALVKKDEAQLQNKHHEHEQMQSEGDKSFTCPMNPEVQSDKPGTCPKCGMALVKKDEAQSHQMHEHGKANEHQQQNKHDGHKGHEPKSEDKKGDENESSDKGGMDGGFMSMVQMTKDMPRSKDGLAMEMNDAAFGPFHPGLPGGLLVKMKLDGDTVMEASVDKQPVNEQLLQQLPKQLSALPELLSRFNPSLHQTYKLLVHKALSDIGANDDFLDEVSILERDRIGSHLSWLSLFSRTIGDRAMYYQASSLCYALHIDKAGKNSFIQLFQRIKKTPYLQKRLSKIGEVPKNVLSTMTGPVVRAAGVNRDERSSLKAYRQIGFKPVILQENNAWGQLMVRIAEMEQSLEMIGEERLAKSTVLPAIAVEKVQGEQIREASVEAPNGRLYLKIEWKDGQLKNVVLQSPSTALAALVPEITKGQELANALVAIAALDISPWEFGAEE